MAITGYDNLVTAIAGAQEVGFVKASVASQTAGRYLNLFRVAGRPGAASNASTGAGNTCSSATSGAIPFTNPAGGALSYLAQLGVSSNLQGSLILYDRLVETSGLSGTVTTAQTVNSVALPARASSGNLWIECYTDLGGTAVTEANTTVTYTNQSGVTGRTGRIIGGIPATLRAGQMIPVSLQAGDTGVQSVQSVTLATSTATAGSFGITLLKRIAEIPMVANGMVNLGWGDTGLPQIDNDACLALMLLNSGTSSPTILGSAQIAQT